MIKFSNLRAYRKTFAETPLGFVTLSRNVPEPAAKLPLDSTEVPSLVPMQVIEVEISSADSALTGAYRECIEPQVVTVAMRLPSRDESSMSLR